MKMSEYIKVLKNAGFKVFMYEGAKTNCHFVKNDELGYVEEHREKFKFSSVHKPNQTTGTGFGMGEGTYEPTAEMAERTCKMFCPNWGRQNFNTVKKYKSAEEYMKKESVLKYRYV